MFVTSSIDFERGVVTLSGSSEPGPNASTGYGATYPFNASDPQVQLVALAFKQLFERNAKLEKQAAVIRAVVQAFDEP